MSLTELWAQCPKLAWVGGKESLRTVRTVEKEGELCAEYLRLSYENGQKDRIDLGEFDRKTAQEPRVEQMCHPMTPVR